MKKAAAYIRVSDERQDEYSPDSQLKLINEYAEKNGYHILNENIFYDDGISAKTAKKRPEFNRMIALAKEKTPPFEAILVWKFSRFARNQEESIVYKNILKKRGIQVISISEPITDSPFGELIERIIEWMDEYYLINLSTEVKRGMLEKASRGEAMCAPAIGYSLVGKKYVPNDQAAHVRMIFSEYLSGMTMKQIALRHAAAGLKTRRGNPVDARCIQYILYNPLYIGKIRWSTGEIPFSKSRKFSDPDILTADAGHEPLIDINTWNSVQEKLKAEKQSYGKSRQKSSHCEWMLKGIVRCGNCSSPLVRSQKDYIQCRRYSKGQGCTISHCVKADKAEALIIEALKSCVSPCSFSVRQAARQSSTADCSELIRHELTKLERARAAYLHGIDTAEEYSINKSEINKAIAELESRITSIKAKEKSAEDFKNGTGEILQTLSSPLTCAQAKNEALHSVLSKVIFNKSQNSFTVVFRA